MRIYTIGFTKKTAAHFFGGLRSAGVSRVVDVRLNNVSQLSGFAKRDDLAFFLMELGDISYSHIPSLAPTQEMLDEYRKQAGGWDNYADRFLALMSERQVETLPAAQLRDGDCLLCSEDTAAHCHRRLVTEYLISRGQDLIVQHLK